MPWWSWIVVGVLLLGAELLFVDAQFYLVFLGVAALIVGGLDLGGVDLPGWQQWLLFSALSIATMITFRKRLYGLMRPPIADVPIGPAGDSVTLPTSLAPGARCRVDYRGTQWDAQNESELTLEVGSSAKILRVDGLTLKIARA
jgi:inner membrane protein